ncbi:MAG: hypothetical protein KAG34_05520 [Cocleimonas sp.]|nr:hypothetical protein [Cocleimonas sp.]
MKTNQTDTIQEVRLLLPWYAKNTLGESQTQWIAQTLKDYPELQQELEQIKVEINFFDQHMASIDTQAYENNPQRFDNLMQKIKQPEEKTPSPSTTKQGLLTQIKSWLSPHNSGLWKASAIMAVALLVLQNSLWITQPSSHVTYQTLSGEDETASKQTGVIFMVSFQAEASMQAIQTLLLTHQLSIIQGPDLAGLYLIKAEKGIDTSKLIEALSEQDQFIQFISEQEE